MGCWRQRFVMSHGCVALEAGVEWTAMRDLSAVVDGVVSDG